MNPLYTLRLATPADVPAIETVMRRSMAELGRTTYDDRQVESSMQYITTADAQLIEDGTYFVAVAEEGRIVGCGGWSRRAKLYTGSADQEGHDRARPLDPATEPARIRAMFVDPEWARRGIGRAILQTSEDAARASGFRRLELLAMTSGEHLYSACGYTIKQPATVDLPDGVRLEGSVMEKTL